LARGGSGAAASPALTGVNFPIFSSFGARTLVHYLPAASVDDLSDPWFDRAKARQHTRPDLQRDTE
jgi:hypothetical protein